MRKVKFGFTLVELAVVVGLFGVLLLIGTDLLIQVINSSNKAAAEMELRQNMSVAMDTISRSVRKARCLSVVNNGLTLNLYSDDLCLSTPPLAIYAVQQVSPYGLTQTVGGITTKIISDKVYVDINSLQFITPFVSLNPQTVRINLKLNITGAERSDSAGTQIATQSVSLRQF